MEHGFEIELEGDSSGSGSGDLFKAESRLLKPGETTRMTVELSEGIHKIECLVEGHDDMGMEGPLDVRKNAPLIRDEGEKSSSNKVEIKDFGFAPDSLTVAAGTKVLWTNEDPTPHTVTSDNDAFDSDVLEPGDTFSFTFAKGIYKYACNIHPDMVGTVTVE
jgi:plastocyanin